MKHNGKLRLNEPQAIKVGGNAAGSYLDQINAFDLRNLSQDQWLKFCGIIYRETCAELARMADDEIPF